MDYIPARQPPLLLLPPDGAPGLMMLAFALYALWLHKKGISGEAMVPQGTGLGASRVPFIASSDRLDYDGDGAATVDRLHTAEGSGTRFNPRLRRRGALLDGRADTGLPAHHQAWGSIWCCPLGNGQIPPATEASY